MRLMGVSHLGLPMRYNCEWQCLQPANCCRSQFVAFADSRKLEPAVRGRLGDRSHTAQ